MTFGEYIAAVKAGTQQVHAGELSDAVLVETAGTLDVSDLMAVTAEAYNRDVFDAGVPWDAAYARIKEALA